VGNAWNSRDAIIAGGRDRSPRVKPPEEYGGSVMGVRTGGSSTRERTVIVAVS
jgi:hypothetical protein